MFIKELMIHIDFLKKEVAASLEGLTSRTHKKLCEVKVNLRNGIEYYQKLADKLLKEQQESFSENLELLIKKLECIVI